MAFCPERNLSEDEQLQIAEALSVADEQRRLEKEEDELIAIAVAVSRCVLDDPEPDLQTQEIVSPHDQEQLEMDLALAVSGAEHHQFSVYIEGLITAAATTLDGFQPHTAIRPLTETVLNFFPMLAPMITDNPQILIQLEGYLSVFQLPEIFNAYLEDYQHANDFPQQPHQNPYLNLGIPQEPPIFPDQDHMVVELPAMYKNYRTVSTQFSEDCFWPPAAIMRQKYELKLNRGQEEVKLWQNEQPESDRCLICWTNVATRVAVPCGHKLGCRICIDKVIEDDSEYLVTGPDGEVFSTDRQVPKQCFVCRSIIGLIIVLH